MGSNSNQKKILLLGVVVAVIILVILNVFLNIVPKKSSSPQTATNEPVPQDIKNKLDQSVANLKKNVAAQQDEVVTEAKKFKDECRFTAIDPKNGAESSVTGKDGLIDYFYTLQVISVEPVKTTIKNVSCSLLQLSLKSRVSKGPTISILLPAGITADIGIGGKVSPLMYKNLINSYITFRLKIQNTTDKDYPYKIIEWQPIRSSIN